LSTNFIEFGFGLNSVYTKTGRVSILLVGMFFKRV